MALEMYAEGMMIEYISKIIEESETTDPLPYLMPAEDLYLHKK